ncbi:MAG: hypothetical protein AB7S81_05485 [Bdellovibrionales bacterium]
MTNEQAEPFKYLTSGIDTLEVSFYLRRHMSENRFPDFTTLAAMKEEIRAQKNRKGGKVIQFGDQEFLLRGHGTNTGFPFFMENEHFKIGFGEFNKPNFSVKFSCEDLWHKGWRGPVEGFVDLVISAGFAPYQSEIISRVDFAFDYMIPHVDFDEDSFYTLAINDGRIRKRGKTQTMRFGSDDVVLRVYNKSDEINEKSGKTWFYPIWGGISDNVWRIEWQFRGTRLREIGTPHSA